MDRFILAVATIAAALPAAAQDVLTPPPLAEVAALAESIYADACPRFPDSYSEEPKEFTIRYRSDFDGPDDPEREMKLYQVFCYVGAYNLSNVYFTWDDVSGLLPLSFVVPRIEVTYEGGETDDRNVKDIFITGLGSSMTLTNPTYHPATETLTSNGYWRGMGDASSGGVWVRRDTDFVLQSYWVDASYDEEVNPVTILDYGKPKVVK